MIPELLDWMRFLTVWVLVAALIATNSDRIYWKNSYLRLFNLTFPKTPVDSKKDKK